MRKNIGISQIEWTFSIPIWTLERYVCTFTEPSIVQASDITLRCSSVTSYFSVVATLAVISPSLPQDIRLVVLLSGWRQNRWPRPAECVVRGYMLLKKLRLESREESMVLTAAKGSMSYKEIVDAIRAIFPDGKGSSSRSKEVSKSRLPNKSDHTDRSTALQLMTGRPSFWGSSGGTAGCAWMYIVLTCPYPCNLCCEIFMKLAFNTVD